jgi:ABC-2 type transport system ATP-binding protein
MSSTYAIEAEGLTKSYRSRRAVDGFTVQVAPGTVLGFLGPNGAGKTTAIRLLTTVLRADAGSFWVAGVSDRDPVGIRRRVGVLPESAGFPEGETGEDVLVFHARLFGRSLDDARADARALLEEVGLGARRGSLVAGYSRGMRQRLGIARALISRPQVVFLDEPTLGLDPAGQRQVLGIVSHVARTQAVTVVLSTHSLAEVEAVCDRVVIINRGRVVAEGTVADVARRASEPRRGRLRVPAECSTTTTSALRRVDAVASVEAGEYPGEITFELVGTVPVELGTSRVLGALLAAQVPVQTFDLEGGRLSDAYLELTADDEGEVDHDHHER